jgi:1-phosphofructokinase
MTLVDQSKSSKKYDVVAVTLSPAIDETLTIPGFAAGKVNRVASKMDHAGGKGVNVALVLSSFGLNVAATGFLGAENRSIFQDAFRKNGVDDLFIQIPGSTRLGLKIIDPENEETTDINQPGLTLDAGNLEALSSLLLSVESEWVVLAGSIAPGTPLQYYRELVSKLAAQGKKVALDTSGSPLKLALESAPTVIKPNTQELQEITGQQILSPSDLLKSVRPILDLGVRLVVVSQGGNGAWFISKEEALLAKPPKVHVASTVGAGDAMVSGIVAAQIGGRSLENTARLATAFSAEAVSRVGAGISSIERIQDFEAQVGIERL